MGIIVETSLFGNFKQEDEPKALIIPAPYEYTTSYCKGTKHGPQAILNASRHLERFDDELWADISSVGINTSNFIECEFANNRSKQPFNELEEAVRSAIINGSVPFVLGGEHSLSYGSIKAVYDLFPDVSVVYFDAFLNLRANYLNNKYSHLSTLRQVCESMPDIKIIQLGTRAVSKEEAEWIDQKNPNLEIFFARDKQDWNMSEIITKLTKNVYISFDFSVLDPSLMPSSSIPEPGGLIWSETIDLIRNICAFKEIVGMDFVELSPIQGLSAPDFLAARLIYKSIGYAFARQLGVFDELETLETISQ